MGKWSPLLEVSDLSVSFRQYDRGLRQKQLQVVNQLQFTLQSGEVLAVIGASGSGKSVLAHAILGILPYNAHMTGMIRYRGQELTAKRQSELRGKEIALVPQSVNYLNPLMRIGKQVRARHLRNNGNQVTVQREVFERYQLKREVESLFPFQLSGGMARRALVATAAMSQADLLIADEPTPGLHPEAVKETLAHLRELANEGRAVMLITHDLASALKIADRVLILYAGMQVELANSADFSSDGCKLRHPYSQALWHALPQNGFVALPGSQPTLDKRGTGCLFAARCSQATVECHEQQLVYRELRHGMVRCIHAT